MESIHRNPPVKKGTSQPFLDVNLFASGWLVPLGHDDVPSPVFANHPKVVVGPNLASASAWKGHSFRVKTKTPRSVPTPTHTVGDMLVLVPRFARFSPSPRSQSEDEATNTTVPNLE
jgi:hypothetical protein